jgi:hypothetical protein
MEITKVKILLRAYPKNFEWEPLESWEKRINEAIKDLDVVAIRPINMDGVLIEYIEDCPNNTTKIQSSYPISKQFILSGSGTGTGNMDSIGTVTWS